MRRIILAAALCLLGSAPAYAGIFTSVYSRAEAVKAQVQGKTNYHAHMARKMADAAMAERGQDDLDAARQFLDIAEEHAAKAGGK